MENLNLLLSALTQESLPSGLIREALYLLAIVLFAWLTAWVMGRHSKTESVLFGKQVIDGLLFPLLALLLTYFVQVLLLKQGRLLINIEADDGVFEQGLSGSITAWDSYAMPVQHWHSLHNTGSEPALVLVLTAGDEKKTIQWCPELVAQAAAAGWAIDANGCTAPKYFVDRAQR